MTTANGATRHAVGSSTPSSDRTPRTHSGPGARIGDGREELERLYHSPEWQRFLRWRRLRVEAAVWRFRLLHPVDTLRDLAAKRLPVGLRMRLLRTLRGEPSRPVFPGVTPPAAPESTGAGADRARPTIVCLPLIEWGLRRQRPQHLLEGLAARGWRVLHASPELRPGSGAATPGAPLAKGVRSLDLPSRRLRDIREGLPGSEDLAVMVTALRNLQEEERFNEAVVLCHAPSWAPLALALKRALGWKLVYDRMDLHTGFSTAPEETVALERRLMEEADLVVATSAILATAPRELGVPTQRIPNGCHWELWSSASPSGEVGSLPHPVIGYFGAISEWFDTRLVQELAMARPTWSFVLVGSTWGADTSRLEQLPNVHLLGERPYEELPGLAAGFDVGIIPFRRTPLTEATDPVKLYEMLALGLDVVTTPLPELEPHAAEGLITTAEGVDAFLDAIERHLGRPTPDDVVLKRRTLARASSWDRRTDQLASALEELWPRVSIGMVTYNQKNLTALCLESILRSTEYPNYEIVVVDNGSTDGTREWLEERARVVPELRVVFNEANEGFAAGCNRAFAEARGKILCFLNNDTVVTRGWLSAMVRELESSPSIGMVGPSSNGVSNAARVEPGYTDLRDLDGWAQDFIWSHRGESFAIPMLALYCAAIRREVWERVGPLDESYATGMFEDDDFSRRLRQAGYELRCLRGAWVHHWQQASFGALPSDEYLRIYEENRRRYLEGRRRERRAPPPVVEEARTPPEPLEVAESGTGGDLPVYDSATTGRLSLVASLQEVLAYRDLLWLLVGTNIKTRYKRSLLGVAWTFLNPLATAIVMTVAFSAIFRFSMQHYAVYVLSGLLFWTFFQQSSSQSMSSLVWGAGLLKKVYVPAAVFPMSAVGTGLVNLLLSLPPLFLIMFVLGHDFSPALLFLPVPVILVTAFTLGLGLLMASYAVYFSDVVEMFGVVLRIWFYLTPVMYPEKILPAKVLPVVRLNPVYNLVVCWRDPIFNGSLPPLSALLQAGAWSAGMLLLGWWVFTRRSHEFSLRA